MHSSGRGQKPVVLLKTSSNGGFITFTSSELMQRSFQEIDASDVVLVDLTEKGVGIGIEAGYAFSKGIPVITIALARSDISTTLGGILTKVFWYANYDDLSTFFGEMGREEDEQ